MISSVRLFFIKFVTFIYTVCQMESVYMQSTLRQGQCVTSVSLKIQDRADRRNVTSQHMFSECVPFESPQKYRLI
jgi:hypothetical protein